jgi:hypothetical protein
MSGTRRYDQIGHAPFTSSLWKLQDFWELCQELEQTKYIFLVMLHVPRIEKGKVK